MDKYRRNDDTNDDLGVYSQNENDMSDEIHTIFKSKTPNQHVTDTESDAIVKETETNNKKILSMLSQQEIALWKRIKKGQSIRRAARLLGITQQTAQGYWKRIKEKMK